MKIKYTVMFVGEMNVPENATKEDVREYIVQECYERGIDTSISDDMCWVRVAE
jgi:hypothetical protein